MLKTISPMEMAETIRGVHAGSRAIPREVATYLVEHLEDEPLTVAIALQRRLIQL
jgi:DNA-binding NarL/FixJ family response regulator